MKDKKRSKFIQIIVTKGNPDSIRALDDNGDVWGCAAYIPSTRADKWIRLTAKREGE